MTIILDGSTGISSIGTLTGVTSISSAAANTPVVMQDSGSNTNTCRAWVNFNGTGTVAIRASFNVTSITDNGTGDYTVNFTVAMPDANYCVVCNSVLSSTTSATGSAGAYGTFAAGASTKTTSAIRTLFGNSSTGNATDTAEANVMIFR
jgi:hypothetical protein